MEMIQTAKASLPVVPAIPPIENSTKGGTPAATQNAPCQLSDRTIPPVSALVDIPKLPLSPAKGATLPHDVANIPFAL
jgi:hypothetical protein